MVKRKSNVQLLTQVEAHKRWPKREPRLKLRKDSHGLYVRTGGHIFRPQESTESYLCATAFGEKRKLEGKFGQTDFIESQEVKAYHISQSPHASINSMNNSIYETWASHGMYIDYNGKYVSSETIWKPKL